MSAAKYQKKPTFVFFEEGAQTMFLVADPRVGSVFPLMTALEAMATFQDVAGLERVGMYIPLRVEMLAEPDFHIKLCQYADLYGAAICGQGRLLFVLGPEAGLFWRRQVVMDNLRWLHDNGIGLCLKIPSYWDGKGAFVGAGRTTDSTGHLQCLTPPGWLHGEGKDFVRSILVESVDLLRGPHLLLLNQVPKSMKVVATGARSRVDKSLLQQRGVKVTTTNPLNTPEVIDKIQSSNVRRRFFEGGQQGMAAGQ